MPVHVEQESSVGILDFRMLTAGRELGPGASTTISNNHFQGQYRCDESEGSGCLPSGGVVVRTVGPVSLATLKPSP